MKTLTLYRPNALQGHFGRTSALDTLGDLDRCLGSFLGDSMLAPATRIFNHMPAVDVRETEKAYVLEMELPGYDEKDIEIHIDGGNLSIASKHEETKDEKGKEENWILKERRTSSFSRLFKLPENANPDEISAEFKNGVLSMEITKRAESQKRVIQINSK